MNKFPFAYRPKASNYVVFHLFSLRSALGFRCRSSPVSGSMVCLVLAIIFTFPPTSLWEREAINLACDFQGIRFLCHCVSKLPPCLQKNEACGSLALSADKNCLLWGCRNKKIFDFQRYSRFTSLPLGSRVPLYTQKRVAPQDNPINTFAEVF